MFETETKKLLSLAKKSNIDFVINKTLERECNILSGMNIPYRSYTTDSELKNIPMNNNTVVLARPHEYNLFHSTPDFFDKMFFKCNSDNLRDFFSDVFPVYTATILNKVFFPHIQLMITPRCTLTCQECCNGCQLWNKKDKSQDMSLDDIKESIDSNVKAQKYQSQLFSNGLTNKMVVQLTSDVKDSKELKKIQNKFDKLYSSNGRVFTVPAGFNVSAMNLSLADSQFAELKVIGKQDIASALGVPYSLIEKGSLTEDENIAFLSNAIIPIITALEQEMDWKLLTDIDR